MTIEDRDREAKYFAASGAIEEYLWSFDPDDIGGGEIDELIEDVINNVFDASRNIEAIVKGPGA